MCFSLYHGQPPRATTRGPAHILDFSVLPSQYPEGLLCLAFPQSAFLTWQIQYFEKGFTALFYLFLKEVPGRMWI